MQHKYILGNTFYQGMAKIKRSHIIFLNATYYNSKINVLKRNLFNPCDEFHSKPITMKKHLHVLYLFCITSIAFFLSKNCYAQVAPLADTTHTLTSADNLTVGLGNISDKEKLRVALAVIKYLNPLIPDSNLTKAILSGPVFKANFNQFRGSLKGKKGILTWSTSEEQDISWYEIERSRDAINFLSIARLNAKKTAFAQYNYTDAEDIDGILYYRLKMIKSNNLFKYSNNIFLSTAQSFEISNLRNPFTEKIEATITIPEAGNVQIVLYNDKGQLIKTIIKKLNKGINEVSLEDWGNLSNGLYFITIEYKNKIDKRKLIRQ